MTATTPIWGKLADLFSKKLLVQTALVIYSVGSLIAGFAPSMEVLIGARAVQGLGVGGLTALVQVVIATHGRARASAAATPATSARRSRWRPSSGPLDRRRARRLALGWRWCFFVGIPVAAHRVRRAAEDAAPAGRQARGPHRLPRRHPARRRRLAAAGLGLAGRQPVRLGLHHQPRPGRRRPGWSSPPRCTSRRGSPASRSSRCGSSATAPRRWPPSPRC